MMVPPGNKAKRLLLVNHTTKTIHRHHHHREKTLSYMVDWVLNTPPAGIERKS